VGEVAMGYVPHRAVLRHRDALVVTFAAHAVSREQENSVDVSLLGRPRRLISRETSDSYCCALGQVLSD